MTNARWCLMHGISFASINVRRDPVENEYVVHYGNFSDRVPDHCNSDSVLAHWLDQEHKIDPILTDREQRYLSFVTKPFADEVIAIDKGQKNDLEYIEITYSHSEKSASLPMFKKGTMYKGMKPWNLYTPEELGLWKRDQIKWIPADQPPEEDKKILLSFRNDRKDPEIGIYRDGAFRNRAGVPLVHYDYFVDAWMPLPPSYRGD